MINTISKCLIFTLLAGFIALSAAAQEKTMYSYTDENGTVVFTDKKPVGKDVKQQAIPAGPPPQGDNPYEQADPAAAISVAQQKRDEIKQGKQKSQDQMAQQQAKCAALQAEVDRLEPNRRVFYENDKGETARMDDVERVNRVAALKGQIAADCR